MYRYEKIVDVAWILTKLWHVEIFEKFGFFWLWKMWICEWISYKN